MEDLRARKLERIRRKTAHLQELILQQIAFKNLVKRNSMSSAADMESGNCVHLPFIIVNTSKHTNIQCQMAEDKSEYFFDFDKPFEIHDDIEVLKRMGLAYNIDKGECPRTVSWLWPTPTNLFLHAHVPRFVALLALESYPYLMFCDCTGHPLPCATRILRKREISSRPRCIRT